MKKKLSIKKTFSTLMVLGMLFQMLAPVTVLAIPVADGNTISLTGDPNINETTFEYENGDVTVTKNNIAVNTTSFSVIAGDQISITLTPDSGFVAELYDNSRDFSPELTENKYEFVVGNATDNTLTFSPRFVNPPIWAIKFDFTINGKSFTNVGMGAELAVSDDFNVDTINEFYVTKIAIGDVITYTYAPGEYSYALMNNENNRVFETHYDKISDNGVCLRVESHSDTILPADMAEGKTLSDYFGFYMIGITFLKSGFRGVEISTSIKPDNYDFTSWNGVDLSTTTIANPKIVTAYYGENTIGLSSTVESDITKIELVENMGVPASAVEISNERKEVTILSNYYNEVPLKITLSDNTVGYVKINRIGIFIGDVNPGNATFYHGAAALVGENLNVDTDKYRIAAVFYHENTTTYNDYDLIVNLTYSDGSTETKMAEGVGDINNSNGNIIGSDYILWKGTGDGAPTKVSVTAVKKSDNTASFAGASFGSGAGVEWSRD